jgi:hypothetical protein
MPTIFGDIFLIMSEHFNFDYEKTVFDINDFHFYIIDF